MIFEVVVDDQTAINVDAGVKLRSLRSVRLKVAVAAHLAPSASLEPLSSRH